jgi:hypothetical protein
VGVDEEPQEFGSSLGKIGPLSVWRISSSLV